MKLRLPYLTSATRKSSRSRAHFAAAPLLVALIFSSASFAFAQTVEFGGGGNADGVRYQTDQSGNKHQQHIPKPRATPADPTWTGGATDSAPASGNWNVAGNWDGTGTIPPVSGNTTALTFGGSGSGTYTSTDNIANNFVFGSITLNSTSTGSNTIAASAGQLLVVDATTGSTITQSGSGAFTISNGFTNNNAATLTLTGAGSGTVTLSGVIDQKNGGNPTTIVKSLASTFVLSGNNTYTGTTTVNGGTLLVNGNQSSATGAVSVNNSGTVLGGTGTIGGAVTINGPATITAGTNGTTGALTLSNGLALAGTSGNLATYLVDLTAITSDKLVISGNLNLSTAFDQIKFQGTTGASSYILATFTGTRSGTFDTVTNLPNGYFLFYGANDIELDAVPEPGTWLAGALAFGSLLATQRRHLARLLKRTA